MLTIILLYCFLFLFVFFFKLIFCLGLHMTSMLKANLVLMEICAGVADVLLMTLGVTIFLLTIDCLLDSKVLLSYLSRNRYIVYLVFIRVATVFATITLP